MLRLGPSRKWLRRRCYRSSMAPISLWSMPTATSSYFHRGAMWSAATTCMTMRMTMLIAIVRIVTAMLEYDFMRKAFAAAGVAALVSGLVGYFLVLRGQTFAGHALGHIGFAGATGAVLIGVASVWGLVVFTVAAGIAMGLMGDRIS